MSFIGHFKRLHARAHKTHSSSIPSLFKLLQLKLIAATWAVKTDARVEGGVREGGTRRARTTSACKSQPAGMRLRREVRGNLDCKKVVKSRSDPQDNEELPVLEKKNAKLL